MLNYDYIKNQYKLITVGLSRQKGLDADPEVVQQIQFVRQLRNMHVINADWAESMFISTILGKMKEAKL